MKSNTLLLLFAFTAALIGCSKDSTPTESEQTPIPTPTFSYQTYSCTGKDAKADSFGLFVEGNSVIFWHYNYYTCCSATVSASFKSKDDSLFITEKDTLLNGEAICLCHFPISSKIDSLNPGKYVLSVLMHSSYWPLDSLIYRDTVRIQ